MGRLTDSEVRAARRFVRATAEVSVVSALCHRVPTGLAELVPADVLIWDRVELATGAVGHEDRRGRSGGPRRVDRDHLGRSRGGDPPGGDQAA
jgi:hypothetical protein